MWVIGGVGFVASGLALASSLVPPSQIGVGNPFLYIGLLVGLAGLIVAVPLVVYTRRRPHWYDPASDVAPFAWEARGAGSGGADTRGRRTSDADE